MDLSKLIENRDDITSVKQLKQELWSLREKKIAFDKQDLRDIKEI